MHLIDRIGRRVKLEHLHVLMAVVQEGGMGKAARRLHTSQPAISRAIAQLEHALGVRLLERRAQGIEPTESGRALLEGGAAVFDELRQAVSRIEHLADPAAGEVRVGSTVFTAASFVSAIIDRFSRRQPRVRFHLVTAAWEALHRDLAERKLDLLITRRFAAHPEDGTEFEFLFDDAFVVAAGAQSPWARRRKIALRDLVDEAWVLPPPESAVSAIAMEAFRASGLDYPRAAVVTLTPEVRMSLLATGRFLTIFPASMAKFGINRSELKVLPVELRTAPVPSGIVTLRNRSLAPVVERFMQAARDVASGRTVSRGRAPLHRP